MTVEIVPDTEGIRLLRGSGEIDVAVVPALLDRLVSLVGGAPAVVLDLSDVTFLDSSGLRVVDRLARECGRVAARFRVVAPVGGPCRRVLEIVGLDELVSDDLASARKVVLPAG